MTILVFLAVLCFVHLFCHNILSGKPSSKDVKPGLVESNNAKKASLKKPLKPSKDEDDVSEDDESDDDEDSDDESDEVV